MGIRHKLGGGLPVGIVGIAAALFLLFVYGYPRLFPLIEASNPENFEQNTSKAVAAGNLDKGLKIARRATELRPLDPMAYTVYGRVLLAAGRVDEALAQLNKAVDVQKKLVGEEYQETREAFYFGPARLTLGMYYLEQNALPLAAANFELARASAAPMDEKSAEYRAAQYRTYAGLGLWARALEFGEPSEGELDGLDSKTLLRVARVGEGRQDWKLVGRLGEKLLAREGMSAEAHYMLGHARLAEGQYAQAAEHLEQAVSGGRTDAAYFLGTALEKSNEPVTALQAFLDAQPDDVYYPFALAKAMALLSTFPEDVRDDTADFQEELVDVLDGEIAKLRLLKPPAEYDPYRRFTPLAMVTSQTHFAAGGLFPVLILWKDRKATSVDAPPIPLAPAQVAFEGSDSRNLLLRRGTDTLLQLQWVENRVNWDSVERLPADAAEVPGWIDTARDWFKLRPEYVARVQKDEAGNSFLNINKTTWLGSVPVPAKDGVGYLFSGRIKCLPGRGSLAWQAFDKTGRVLFEDDIAKEATPDSWTWHASYMDSQLQWDTLRVQISVLPRPGAVGFDDVMLVEINEPDPSQLD